MRRATADSPAWAYMLGQKPDLALLQEVGAIPNYVAPEYGHVARLATGKTGRPQRFSTAILVRGSINDPIPLSSDWDWVNSEIERFHGNIVAYDVTLRNGASLKAISVYSPAWPIDPDRLEGVDVQDVKLQYSPDVWLTEILWAALLGCSHNRESPWIVAGDLNSSETFDHLWPYGPHGNKEVLDRMTELGFTECLRHINGEVVPTFRNPRGGKVIHQMDHLFVSPVLAKRLQACETGDPSVVFGESLSDHLPIMAQIADCPPENS